MKLRFTQKVKDNWLTALKSGKYTQGFFQLVDKDADNNTIHCCIGVLGEIHPKLYSNGSQIKNPKKSCPYSFLKDTIGIEETKQLYVTNDELHNNILYAKDYSNVIPLIESLPVTK